jgi:hypothetical protein
MKTFLTFSITLFAISFHIQAATIVSWGGDVVSADQALTLPSDISSNETIDRGWGDATVDSYAATFFDSATSIAPGSGYTGGAFYGGFGAAQVDDALGNMAHSSVAGSRTRIGNLGTADELVWGVNNGRSFASTTLWSTSAAALDSGSSMELNITFIGNNGGEEVRFMVEKAGSWYVSTTANGSDTTGLFSLGGATLQNELWIPVTLNDNIYTPLNYNTGVAGSTLALTDIDFVGFYFRTPTNSENGDNLRINSFEVVAIPEPSSLLLLGAAMLGFFLVVRRR